MKVITIRATCPECGDVEITNQDMTVRVCADDNRGSYHFRCPECSMVVCKAAEQRVVDLLVSSHVPYQVWSLPLELRERPIARPISHDDVLDFCLLLYSNKLDKSGSGRLEREVTWLELLHYTHVHTEPLG